MRKRRGERMHEDPKHSGCRRGLNVKPGDCSAEQIKECHGTEPCHPCTTDPTGCSPEKIKECHGADGGHPCTSRGPSD
jgi:hypothetical protein